MSASKLAQLYEDLKDGVRRGESDHARDEFPYTQIEKLIAKTTSAKRRRKAPDTGVLARFLEVRALAERVFGDEKKAEAWLSRPNPSLSGQIPIELLKDELGAAVVRETLEQIDNGIFA